MSTLIIQVLVVYYCLVAGNSFGGAQGQAAAAACQDADKVVALPGQPANVEFNLYAGNVTVNAGEGRDLFYVFAQCSNDAAGTKPLVLWFNGGKYVAANRFTHIPRRCLLTQKVFDRHRQSCVFVRAPIEQIDHRSFESTNLCE